MRRRLCSGRPWEGVAALYRVSQAWCVCDWGRGEALNSEQSDDGLKKCKN